MKNFGKYLETVLISSKVLRMGIQKKPYQKTYELAHKNLRWILRVVIGNLIG